MIKNYDGSVKVNINPNWAYIPYRILLLVVQDQAKLLRH